MECPSRGQRYEPARKQGPFEGSFRQRRARLLRLVAAEPQPAGLDPEALELARRRRPGASSVDSRGYPSLVTTRYDELIAALREARAARPRRPGGLRRRTSRRFGRTPTAITDADVEALKAAGHSEDEIFEQTVSAAVGAGLSRLDAGLEAMG